MKRGKKPKKSTSTTPATSSVSDQAALNALAYQRLSEVAFLFADEHFSLMVDAREAFEQAIKDRATELHQRDWLNADADDTESI